MQRRSTWAGVALGSLAAASACSGSTHLEDVYVVDDGGAAGQGTAVVPNSSSGGATTNGGDSGLPTSGATSGGSGVESGADGGDDVDGDVLYFKASNPDAQDWFGRNVALSGDWLAIAAPHESSSANGLDGDQLDDSEDHSGAVYLFSHQADGWAQRAYLKASTVRAGDAFGYALALSGNTLAVGSPFEDGGSTGINGPEGEAPGGNHGAAYVFVEDAGRWRQQAYVKATNTGAIDLFGSSVALDSDVLVVGAPWEDSAATGVAGDQTDDSLSASGAAYVYERTGDEWQPLAYLKASNADSQDEFGRAVAVSDNIVAVGAPGESSSADDPNADASPESGAVYVFERAAGTYRQAAYLKASNADDDDRFGEVLALRGAVLAVGAPGEATASANGVNSNELLPDSGAVYVFEREGSSWQQAAFLKAPTPATHQYFGLALAVLDGTLVVGALGDDAQQLPASGAVYVYARRPDDGWVFRERLVAPNAERGDGYGASLALSPSHLAIGDVYEAGSAPGIGGDWNDNRAPQAGAVFLLRR